MIKNNKGFGIAESIILCGFLIFIMIPLFSSMSEKVYLKYSVHKINELADTAVMSAVFSINTEKFSEKKLVFEDETELENRIYSSLIMNSFGGMEIIEFEVSSHKKHEICSLGCTSEYEFVHLLMKVSLERYEGGKQVEFYIHRDIEFPFNR